MEEQLIGKTKLITDSFQYSPKLTFEMIEAVHVPSVWFQNRAVLEQVLDYAVKNGYLILEGHEYRLGVKKV